MDQIPLVIQQIEDGERLIERLLQEGFPVVGAAWIKIPERVTWRLHLVSPVVKREGIRKAYVRMAPVVRQLEEQKQPRFWMELSDVDLVAPSEPIARTIAEKHKRSKSGKGLWYYGPGFGDIISIDGAYIYPPIAPVSEEASE